MFEKVLREKKNCDMKGSGWSFVKVSKFKVRVNKNNPLRGAGHIPLPKKFTNAVNPRNTVSYCFKYCILQSLLLVVILNHHIARRLICKIDIIGKIYYFQ